MTIEQRNALAEVITVDKEVMHGTPCFANTRVPVKTLVDFLETGESVDDFLAVYPYIPRRQVLSFLELSHDITLRTAHMRVFIDACIDPRVAEGFAGHEVKTAVEMGWRYLKDHELTKRLQGQFDVLVTIDQGFEYEHNLKVLRFGIVIVHVEKNKVEFYRPLFTLMQAPVNSVKPGEVKHVYSVSADRDQM